MTTDRINKSMSMFVRSFVHSLCILRYGKHASQFVVSTTSSHSLPWHEKASEKQDKQKRKDKENQDASVYLEFQ